MNNSKGFQGAAVTRSLKLSLFAALAALSPLSAQVVTAQNYNLIILNDLSTTSHVGGRTVVGHNFTSNSIAEIGGQITTSPTDRMLVVAGNILGSGNMVRLQQGSAYLDGTSNQPLGFNGGGQLFHSTGLNVAQLKTTYQNASTYYKNTVANNTVSIPSSQPAGVLFNAQTANSKGQAIFNVSGADLFGSNKVQQIDLTIGTGVADVVINVSGTTIDYTKAGNFVGGLTNDATRARVLWNFYEATSINLGKGFGGTILAPYASVNANSYNIDGRVISYNLTTTAEVHNVAYNGPPLETVPEPGIASLLGAAGLLYLLRRKRGPRQSPACS